MLSPSASRRTQPVTVTSPGGGSGTSSGVAPRLSVANQPRSTSTLDAVGELQGHDDVDTGLAVAGPVADDHGVLDGVRSGGLDDAPLVGVRHGLARGHHVGHRFGAGHLVALDDRVAFLAVLEAVELPLAEAPGDPGEADDHQCEGDPAARDQEPQRVHAPRLSGTS